MNERIRQLWEDNDSITVVWPETGSPVRVSAGLLEKFAELIVRQCIAIVDKYGDSDEGNHIAYQIEQHFGVKE